MELIKIRRSVREFTDEKISDDDIGRFNVDRSYETLRNNYTTQGLTCK